MAFVPAPGGLQRWIARHRVAVLVIPAVICIGGTVAYALLDGQLAAWGAALVVLVGLSVFGGWWAVVSWGVSVIRAFDAVPAADPPAAPAP
jgi:hypothetical protein